MRPIPFHLVRDGVLSRMAVPREEFEGIGRHPKAFWARRVVVYMAKRLTHLSYPEIAQLMARPNHSSVITQVRMIEGAVEALPFMADFLGQMEISIRRSVETHDRLNPPEREPVAEPVRPVKIDLRRKRQPEPVAWHTEKKTVPTLASRGTKSVSQPAHVAGLVMAGKDRK